MTDAAVRAVNIALQGMCALEGIVMVLSFRSGMLRTRSEKLFFAKIAAATAGVVFGAVYYMRGPVLRDPLNVILLSLSHVGLYAVYYIYIEYLEAQIRELGEERPVPKAVTYIALIICVIGSTLWVVSAADRDFGDYSAAVMHAGVSFETGHIGGIILIIITSICHINTSIFCFRKIV